MNKLTDILLNALASTVVLAIVMITLYSLLAHLERKPKPPNEKYTVPEVPMITLVEAMIQVESGGKLDAIGAAGEVGCLQITKICMDDINRILGYVEYVPHDRFSRERSIAMCMFYMDYWTTQAVEKHNAPYNIETMSRVWNGGPNGWRYDSTVVYWNKVMEQLQ